MSGGEGNTEGNGGRKEGEEVNNLTQYEAEKTPWRVVELQSQGNREGSEEDSYEYQTVNCVQIHFEMCELCVIQ